MDSSFLKENAARCRSLADTADEFTKRRLLDLAARYDGELKRPSRVGDALLAECGKPSESGTVNDGSHAKL
jgi:hypothetical protein